MRRRALVGFIAATAIIGALFGAEPALADTDADNVIVTIANARDNSQGNYPQFHQDGGAYLSSDSSTRHLFVVFDGGFLEISAALNEDLHIGAYPAQPGGGQGSQNEEFRISFGSGVATQQGFEIRDLAADASGKVTRFDIVFEGVPYFGEVRMGEPEAPVRLTATDLVWPQTPVKSQRIWVVQSLRNTTASPAVVGKAIVKGAAATDWAIREDTCSTTTVPAGGACTLQVGFSPKAAGVRAAVLRVPVSGQTASMAMTGTAPAGITRFSSWGDDVIHGGKRFTDTESDGRTKFFDGWNGGGYYDFSGVSAYGGPDSLHDWLLSIPGDHRITNGRHTFTGYGDSNSWGSLLATDGHACGSDKGVMTVKNAGLAADGEVEHMRIDMSFDCGVLGKYGAEFLWRYRNDVTAPKGPRSLTLSSTTTGRTVTWGTSASKDAASTIVRLVPGDGSSAQTTSGYALGSGSAGSAALPPLPAGQRFTVMAWSVDTTGNLSGSLRRALTT